MKNGLQLVLLRKTCDKKMERVESNALKQKEISPYNIKKALSQFEDEEYLKTFEDIAYKGFVYQRKQSLQEKK